MSSSCFHVSRGRPQQYITTTALPSENSDAAHAEDSRYSVMKCVQLLLQIRLELFSASAANAKTATGRWHIVIGDATREME